MDILNRQLPDDRMDVSRKRVVPLLPVLRVAPSGLVRLHVLRGAPRECDRLRLVGLLCSALGHAGFDGISALLEELPAALGLFAGLTETDGIERTQPHLTLLALQGESEQPAFVELPFCLAGGRSEEH